jgi:hypothetical protein
MQKSNHKQTTKPNPNASMAMLFVVVSSVLVLIVGGFFAYIGLFLNANVASTFDSQLNPAAAIGKFTFSGTGETVINNGELINITNSNGNVYRFEFNTSGNPNLATVLTANAIRVNITSGSGHNTSILASGNLTTAINANTSTSALVTAVNTTNLTTLTFTSTGIIGNSITLSDNAINIASSGMSGGVEGTAAWATTKANVMTGYTVIGIIFIIIGAAGCILGLMSLVGYVGGGKRR